MVYFFTYLSILLGCLLIGTVVFYELRARGYRKALSETIEYHCQIMRLVAAKLPHTAQEAMMKEVRALEVYHKVNK
jgi:DNA-binding FadR family transcriptional regulator